MRIFLSCLAVALLVPYGGALAQQTPQLRSGRQVRITAPECGLHGQSGIFDGLAGDTLVLEFGASTVRCARTSVRKLDQRYESESNVAEGLVIGLVIGGAGGAVVGAAAYEKCVPQGFLDCFMAPESAGQLAAVGALLGGSLGAGIGALIGALSKTDRWDEVPLDRVRVSVHPRWKTFAVRLTARF